MKKFQKSALALALTASAGMANAAGYIDINAGAPDALQADQACSDFLGGSPIDGTGPVCLDGIVLDGTNEFTIDPTDATGGADATLTDAARSVVYAPNTNIAAGSTITFRTVGGAISNADVLVLDGVADLTDFDTNADGTGYTRMRFVVSPGASLSAGTEYALLTAGGGVTPNFVIEAGAEIGDALTLAATSAQDSSGIDIVQGTAPAETLVDIIEGTSVTVEAVTSIIDVEPPSGADSRTEFVVNDPAGPSETGLDFSTAGLTVVLGAEIGPDFTDDEFVITLQRDNDDGVVNVELDILGPPTPGVAFTDEGSGVYTLTANNTTPATPLAGDHLLRIETDGTSVLSTGDWMASIEIDDAGGVGVVNALDMGVSHSWGINGAQFKVPYHAQNASGFVFFFNAVNETANDAALAADVIVENKTTGVSYSLSAVDLGIADANGSTTVGQAAIKAAIIAAGGEMNDVDVYHVAMTVTANAPQNAVQLVAFQKDAVGRTSVPVYVNTNNAADGRKWQQ